MTKVVRDNLKMKKKKKPTETQIECGYKPVQEFMNQLQSIWLCQRQEANAASCTLKLNKGTVGKSGRENAPSSSLQRTVFCHSK